MKSAPYGFSVIIPAYRSGHIIAATLESIAAQTHLPREVLIYEDGHFDNLAEVVTAFAQRAPFHVGLYGSAKNRGVSRARNALLAEARGRYIAFLDADDLWAPDHLEKAHELLSAGADVVFSGVTFVDGEGRPLPGRAEPSAEELAHMAPAMFHYNFVQCPSTLCLRSKCLGTVGVFDTNLTHGEDLDLWLRLLQSGARWRYSGHCTCAYRKHPNSAMSQTLLMVERMADFFEKHFHNPQVPRRERRRALISNRRVQARLNWRRRPVEAAAALKRLISLQPWNPVYPAAWLLLRLRIRLTGASPVPVRAAGMSPV